MRILSWRHAAHWLHPARLPEAVRRIVRAWRGTRWCRRVAVEHTPSGRLHTIHAARLDDAAARVDVTPVRLGGAGNLELLFDLCEEVGARRVVETGVAYGWSSLAILLSIVPRGGHLWSTDLAYRHTDGAQHVGIAVPTDLREFWTLLPGYDHDQVPVALEQAGVLDLAHYDSDKTPSGMLATCTLLFEALRPGGVLVVDDAGDHLGLRTLAQRLGVEPTVVQHDGKFQGILRKP